MNIRKITFPILLIVLLSYFTVYSSYSQQTKTYTKSEYSNRLSEGTDTSRINALLVLSSNINCNDSATKLKFLIEAEELAMRIKWSVGIIRSNTYLGSYYFNCLKDYRRSIFFHSKSLSLALTNNDSTDVLLSCEYIAKDYEALGAHDSAIECLNKALNINTDPKIKISLLGNLGVVYNGIGEFRQALSCYNNALKILDVDVHTSKLPDLLDTITKGGLLLNIGDIYLAMSQPDKALENYRSVYKISHECHNDFLRLITTTNMGKALFFKKCYPEAIKNLELALTDSRTIKEPIHEAGILDQLANTYLATGDINKATEFAEASLKIAEVNSFNDQLPKTYTTLGKLLTLKGENKLAIDYLQKAQDLSLKSRALEDEKNAWEALSVVYDKMQQPAMALSAYRHFIALRDSVYNIDKANELVRIDLQASFGRKQLADSLKQAGQYEIRMQKQTVLTYSGFVGLLLVLLLSFFVYRNYNTQKKYNQLLSKEKELNLELIKAQSSVLTDIAYTQSHEIRGPVSTLLGLVQIFNFDDPADPENKDIIEGIALVTERLDKTITEVINKENEVHSKEIAGRKG